MSSQKLDDEAILEVAREIRNDAIRGKCLNQVCDDPELPSGLDQQARRRKRLLFGLRSLLIFMLVAGVMSALLGITVNSAVQARRMEMRARLMAEMEHRRAVEAKRQAEAAAMQLQASQNQESTP